MSHFCFTGAEYMDMWQLNELFQWMAEKNVPVPVTEDEYRAFHVRWAKHRRANRKRVARAVARYAAAKEASR